MSQFSDPSADLRTGHAAIAMLVAERDAQARFHLELTQWIGAIHGKLEYLCDRDGQLQGCLDAMNSQMRFWRADLDNQLGAVNARFATATRQLENLAHQLQRVRSELTEEPTELW